MNQPLLITDCDEVLLHMLTHFADWIGEAHGMDFALDAPGFREALTYRATAKPVEEALVWPLLDGFFDSEMHRQNVVPGALDALAAIGAEADIVVLTNLGDGYHAARVEQLRAHGIDHRVRCNRGGKGPPAAELIAEFNPSATVFVDDLAVHHESVAKHAPGVWRLHMIAEPRVAAHTPPAPFAHARIDGWDEATDWVLARFAAGPALASTKDIR